MLRWARSPIPPARSQASTGNGIAVYKFSDGQLAPERFIKIPPQQPRRRERSSLWPAYNSGRYRTSLIPQDLPLLPGPTGDRLLIANNLSDNAIVLDTRIGKIVQSFDLSRSRYIPSEYPYTVVANKVGTRAWVSLWNSATS